jgi:hypothetical protein|tara:strand:+ start:371 stop:559 length:189 start_codon:yes stop_codon:yes gene_type:complete
MIDITTAIFITMGACVVTYFWGKSQVDVNFIIGDLIDNLKKGGYVKTKILDNGEEELIKLDD